MADEMTQDDMTVLLRKWLQSLRDEGKSKNTLRAYGDSVRALMRWQEQQGTAGLTREATAGFLGSILDAGGRTGKDGKATANLRARSVRSFSAWCYAQDQIDADELAGLKPPQATNAVVPKLSDDELRNLIAVCRADKSLYGLRDLAIVRLCSEAGCRADEVLSMDYPADIDLRRGIAVIRHGKGDKARTVPVGDDTALAISKYLRERRKAGIPDEGPLWLSQRKGRLSYPGLYSSLGKRAQAAGIEHFHPHRLRHTFASRWRRAGGSESGLMEVGGWSSLEMVQRYTQDAKAELAIEEARKLNLGKM